MLRMQLKHHQRQQLVCDILLHNIISMRASKASKQRVVLVLFVHVCVCVGAKIYEIYET